MVQDILLDDVTFDLLFADGGLVIGDCNQQWVALLLLSEPGDAKDYPTRGVGLIDYVNTEDPGKLIGDVRVNLTNDGAKTKSVKYVNGELEIDARYGN